VWKVINSDRTFCGGRDQREEEEGGSFGRERRQVRSKWRERWEGVEGGSGGRKRWEGTVDGSEWRGVEGGSGGSEGWGPKEEVNDL